MGAAAARDREAHLTGSDEAVPAGRYGGLARSYRLFGRRRRWMGLWATRDRLILAGCDAQRHRSVPRPGIVSCSPSRAFLNKPCHNLIFLCGCRMRLEGTRGSFARLGPDTTRSAAIEWIRPSRAESYDSRGPSSIRGTRLMCLLESEDTWRPVSR
jgi:hypothetical protein